MAVATRPPPTLKAKPPTTVQKRLKMLLYGPAGAGKTTSAIQFPRPYVIDTEKGAENDEYVRLMNDAGAVYMFSNDPEEVIDQVRALLVQKHEYQTLIIDPLTPIYNDLLDRAAEEVGTDFGRHKGPANRTIKRMLNLLTRLDMNVIITSHAKPKWVRAKDQKGKDTAVQEGNTYECYDGLDYLFDLVIEVGRRGKDRIGTIRKTRIEAFPLDEVIAFNYDEVATRYGRHLIERESVAIVPPTADQLTELNDALQVRADRDALIAKWLKAANAEDLAEMSAEQVAKCIDFLNTRKPAKVEAAQ